MTIRIHARADVIFSHHVDNKERNNRPRIFQHPPAAHRRWKLPHNLRCT